MQRSARRGKPAAAPVARNMSSRQSGSNTSTYVRTERIATIPGSVSFATVASIPCNPGLSASFPWLSGHGRLYENYIIRKLVYRYKNFKGTSTPGNIILSFDPDPLDAAPDSGVAAMQSFRACDGAPWRIFQMTVPSMKKELFTRKSTIAGSDLKTYDAGTLFVSAEGCADTSDHGYIEVDYHIDLIRPQAADSVATGASTPMSGLSTTVHTITNNSTGTLVGRTPDTWDPPNGGNISPVSIALDHIVSGDAGEFLFNMSNGVLSAKESCKMLLNLQGAWYQTYMYITNPDPVDGEQLNATPGGPFGPTTGAKTDPRFNFELEVLVNGQESGILSRTPYPQNLTEKQSLYTSSLIPATGVVELNPGDVLTVCFKLGSCTEDSSGSGLVWNSDGTATFPNAVQSDPWSLGLSEKSLALTMIQVS